MLAILAVALATLAPSAMAAEGQGDNNAGKQPTMAELASKVDSLGTTLGSLRTELGTLARKVDTLSSTVTANHATIVGKFATQMAVVMVVPTSTSGYRSELYLVGNSSIAGFPAGTVAANGKFTDTTLPAGTYLFELQHPYGDNAICNGRFSRRWRHRLHAVDGTRRDAVCPNLYMVFHGPGVASADRASSDWHRLHDGSGVYTNAEPRTFSIAPRFPSGLTFTDDNPLSSYSGSVRITKLK